MMEQILTSKNNWTNINTFPEPQADECLFSIIIRFHLLSGNRKLDESIRMLTESHSTGIFSVIPRYLHVLAKKITDLSTLNGYP